MKIKILQDWTWGKFYAAGSIVDVDDATLASITATGAIAFEPVVATAPRVTRDARPATVRYVAKSAASIAMADAKPAPDAASGPAPRD